MTPTPNPQTRSSDLAMAQSGPITPAELVAAQRALVGDIVRLGADNAAKTRQIDAERDAAEAAANQQAQAALDKARAAVVGVAEMFTETAAASRGAGFRVREELPTPRRIGRPELLQITDIEIAVRRARQSHDAWRKKLYVAPGKSGSAVNRRFGLSYILFGSVGLFTCGAPFFAIYWLVAIYGEGAEGILRAVDQDYSTILPTLDAMYASDPTSAHVFLGGCVAIAVYRFIRNRFGVPAGFRTLAADVADAMHKHDTYAATVDAARVAAVAAAVAEAERRHAQRNEILRQSLKQLHERGHALATAVEAHAPPWSAPTWAGWSPPAVENPILPLGDFRVEVDGHSVVFPAHFDRRGGRSLIIETRGNAKAEAVAGLQALVQRLLVSLPPGRARFVFVDPIGLGQAAAPIMRLADLAPEIVDSRAWTEPDQIERRLADLTEHMQNVIQKYLRTDYADIDAYNAQAGETAEAYRFLVISDFPAGFSPSAAERLISIMRNGPRCGVYALIVVDTSLQAPYGFQIAEVERYATVFRYDGTSLRSTDDDLAAAVVDLARPAEAVVSEPWLTAIGTAAVDVRRIEVPFSRIQPPQAEWWQASSADGLEAAIGPSGARTLQRFRIGDGVQQHCLVAGQTGSGKTNLLHVLITMLALRYAPEEVELYLVDFKEGVGFKPYATNALPHARVVAIESEREFGLSVLQGLADEIERRGQTFRAAGVAGIAQYRRQTGRPMPRILLIVDEFQVFFAYDDKLSADAGRLLDGLVRQGRSFGIHVLLGSQTLAGIQGFGRSTIGQMGVRIALPCQDADSRLILADDNPAARLLARPGEGIYNAANGLVEGNQRFQTVLLRDHDHDSTLRDLATYAAGLRAGAPSPAPPIVFEGNAPAHIATNALLADAIQSPPRGALSTVTAWLGDPVAIRPPAGVTFLRQSGRNVLIVGRNEELAIGMLVAAVVSIAAQTPPAPGDAVPPIVVLDLAAAGDALSPLATLARLLPDHVTYGRRRDVEAFVARIADEVHARCDPQDEVARSRDRRASPCVLVVCGLHRATEVIDEPGAFGFPHRDDEAARPSPAEQFRTIVAEGPDVGVHALLWANNLAGAERILDRRMMREVSLRVALQVPADDSMALLDSPAAGSLGSNRALLFDEDEGTLLKFRPYQLARDAWLVDTARRIRTQGA